MAILFAHNFRLASPSPERGPGFEPPRSPGGRDGTPVARTSGHDFVSPDIIRGLAWLFEVAILAGTGVWAQLHSMAPVEVPPAVLAGAVFTVEISSILALRPAGAHQIESFRSPLRHGTQIAMTWIAIFGLVYAGVRVCGLASEALTFWLLHWLFAALGTLGIERALLLGITSHMSRARKFARRTAIVGGGLHAQSLLQQLAAGGGEEVEIVGIFDDRMDHRSPDVISGFPKLGSIDDLVSFGQRSRLDLVIVALPIAAEHRLLDIARRIWVLPVDIRLSTHLNKLQLGRRTYSFVGGVPLIDLYDRPLSGWNLVIKNLFDRVTGLVLLAVALPVMIAVAIAIKLDTPGPVLFRQKRYGFNNELIEVFKFRSMYVAALDYDAVKLVTRGDPRVTRVGRFLRRTSLDELPQLLNVVLAGNLSLVGPRPHAIQAKAADRLYTDVVDGYFARHRVRPGMTGWAQINGWRGETDTSEKIQKRVEHDLYYIENWSLMLDIYVLLRTPFAVIRGEGAF